jgi:DNA-binding CsgD family transcriptional regulator
MHQPAAIEHLAEALSITTEPRERASIAQVLSTALLFADRCHDAVGILDRAVNELDAVDPVLAQALEAQLIGVSAQQLSTREVHARHFERVRARALGDSPAERQLLAHLAHWTGIAGDAPASVLRTLAERAAAEGELLAEVTSDSQTFYCVPCCLYYSDSLEPARYWLDRALDDARARGSLVGFATASCLRSDVLYRLGELAEAEADARAAIEAAGSEGWVLAPAAVDFLTQVLIERGELTEAEALVAGSQIPTGLDEPVITNWLLHARALLQLANGELQSATDNLLRCGEWFNAWGARNPGVIDWRTDATLALAQLGELDHARRLSAEAIGLSKTMEEPRSLGMALRAAGIIEGGADGVDLLREAVTTLASSPARLEHARALVDLGAALRRQNHRKEAREPLRQGTALAGRSGATVLAGRGQSELIATGARPRRLSLSGIEALTPQERRVAGLAADGLSSPQIAQQLFVTVNTVESHLRHAYAKLDIHSRNELPRALATS